MSRSVAPSLFTQALDLVFPRRCVGCGRVGFALCLGCLPIGAVLWLAGDAFPTVAAAEYAGAVRAALIRYKERGRRDLAPPLGDLLLRSAAAVLDVTRAPPQAIRLVPVPSARAAAAARGGDHVARLARRAGAALGAPLATPLSLSRPVADSAGLTAGQRAANLNGAFAAQPPGSGNPPRAAAEFALLVDDIATTGATLREAHRALAVAGWSVVGAAVVAATPLRGRQAFRSSSIGTAHVGGLA